ncbi:MAG: hypothetical protein IME96_04335 [Proteobacteria bacterium]|nr:hypothetical protein [Pseudomonadota bacterium]
MKKSLILLLSGFLFFLTLFPDPAAASEMELGRMRVAIWPEYDDPGVLVIYDGRFVDDGSFPTETSFFLPKGAIISDACSLSPRGQHFCQLFKQKNVGDMDEVRLKLPFPNFYLSFHVDLFAGDDPVRDFIYKVKTSHRVRKLEIDIQEPLRAEGFTVTPEPQKTELVDGFKHYRFYIDNQDMGADMPFEIKYKKDDNRPSVNIKYSPMSSTMNMGGMSKSPYGERRNFLRLLYVLAGSGLVIFLGLLWFVFRKKKV